MNYRRQKKQLAKQLANWQKEKQLIIIKQDLKEEKKKIKERGKTQKTKMTTTKFLMTFLFTSCSAIEIFTMYVIVKGMNMGLGADFTPLQMLITAVVAEVIGFSVYSLKSLKENTKGGIVYQTAMLDKENNQEAEG